MTKKAVIFDLDGTLIDSAIVILRIINRMRQERGWSELSMGDVRPHLSKGGYRLVKESLGEASLDGASDLVIFREYYHESNQGTDILYDKVVHVLGALRLAGYTLGICTNKPQILCEQALQQTGLECFFDSVVSAGENGPAKPDPHAYLLSCSELGVDPRETILVGDSEVDRDTAKAVGAQFVLVTYGYPIGGIDTIDAAAKCHEPADILLKIHDVFKMMDEVKLGEPVT